MGEEWNPDAAISGLSLLGMKYALPDLVSSIKTYRIHEYISLPV